MDLEVNGKKMSVDVPPDTPLLWVIREELKLKGTKFGCGKGICGSCTVHLNGQPTRTCILPSSAAQGQKVTTIDGLSKDDLHPVQKAWIKHGVPQCGYCQSGQLMLAMGLLENQKKWTEDSLMDSMDINLCRCGTYNKMKLAVIEAAKEMGRLS